MNIVELAYNAALVKCNLFPGFPHYLEKLSLCYVPGFCRSATSPLVPMVVGWLVPSRTVCLL